MENENEPLDWGNEEEEQQHTHRRASHDYTARQELDADADEAGEDAISLGDEDEDGYYFQREDAQRQELSVAEAEESFEKPQSPRRQDDSLGANEQRRNEQPRYHDDRGRYERSPPPRSSNVQPDSPPREQPSRPQTSPGQIATTRLKHALPPKPASAKVPYLPPSHPSIVAATSMTEMPSRDTPHDAKPNGAGSAKPAAGATPLPHPWELRTPRGGGQLYYYNPETHASTWIHPVSNVSIYTPPQYRHHAGSRSPTEAYVTPSDPNMHQARGQASRPHADRDIPRGRSDRDIDNAARTDDSDRRDMSYRDRHYRPSGDPAAETAPVVHEARPAVRSDAMSGQYSARSRYDRSPPPASPPRQRRHARSVSPSDTRTLPVHPRSQEYPPPRGSHPGPRDRHGYTNAAPVIQRDTDITPRDRWAPSHIPPTEYERSDRVPHKPAHRPGNADERGYAQFSQDEPRPHIQRRESSRGPPRDRDNSRHPDVHEYPSGNSGFISAPRLFPRERDGGRDYPPFRDPGSAPGQSNADRKDRPPPFDRSTSSNGPPPNIGHPDQKQFNPRASDHEQFNPRASDREQFNPRATDREQFNPRVREYDTRPPPAYDQRRPGEREYERPRREGPPDVPQPRRHPNEYPPRDAPPAATSSRPPRYPDAYDRGMPEDPSQRRRQPLPPQTATYATVPTPRSPPNVPVVIKQPGWANFDSSLPRRPKFEVNNAAMHAKEKAERLEREKALKQQAETGALPLPPVERPAPPANEPERRNGPPAPQAKAPEQRGQYTQRPPRLDTRMDIDPRDAVDMRRAPSPRGMRSTRVPQDEGGQQYPGGPRSARTPTERAPYSAPAAVAPPPNARFENGFQGLPPPPRDAGHLDERRFHELRAENRSDWRNNRPGNERPANDRLANDRVVNDRPGNGYPERGPVPTRRDFRGRPDEIDTSATGSGPNNMPIGNRRDSAPVTDRPASYPPNSAYFPRPLPQASGFNPNARPPPSALIRPAVTSEFKHGQESYTRPSKPPAAEEPRRNAPPVPTQYVGPQPTANQSAAVSAEGTGARRRVSRFSPLVSKPDSNQEQATQHPSRGSAEEPHQRERAATPPPMSRDPSMLSEHRSMRYSDPLQPSEGRRSPQGVERAKIEMRARAAWRAERSAQNRPADTAVDATAADRVGSSQTASTLSTESVSSQRPRYKWSEQMANAAAPVSPEAAVGEPDLSLRLSSEKPPRHRKYSAPRFTADDSMLVDAPTSDEPLNASPENTVNFLDRLDAPILSRRSSKLLDRLSVAQDSAAVSADIPETPTPSLRDRLVPSKRGVDDMMDAETGSYEGDDNENKRLKRRTSKAKRGGRR